MGRRRGTRRHLFGPKKKVAPDAAGPAPGGALTGACWIPGEIGEPGGEREALLGERRGTIELWFAPDWRGAAYRPTAPEYRPGTHVLVHAGPPVHGRVEQGSRLLREAMLYLAFSSKKYLTFAIRPARINAGWSRTARIDLDPDWLPGRWRHVACVWDAGAPPEDWLRLFIDGRLTDRTTQTSRPERLGSDPAVRYRPPAAYLLQIGALNDGRGAARGRMAGLRISRSARYTENFDPPAWPLEADDETTALLPLDGTLEGLGVSTQGRRYRFEAVAGLWEE